MTPAQIEQTKHMASWLNAMATSISTAGAVVPLVAYVTETLPGTAKPETIAAAGVICTTLGLTLHFVGREILGEI